MTTAERVASFRTSMAATLSPNTADAYAAGAELVEAFLTAQGARLEDGVTESFFVGFVEWLGRTRHSPGTVRLRTIGARRYLEWARSRGYRVPPISSMHRPRLPRMRQRVPNVLRGAQLSLYVEHAGKFDEPYATVLRLLPATGLRAEEALRMTAADIEIVRSSGGPSQVWFHVRGQRGTGNAKSKKDRRVPLLPDAYEAFRQYLSEVRPRLGGGRWLFPGPKTGKPPSKRHIERLVAEVGDLMGIRLYPHALRHTYLTLLADHGVGELAMQDVAGHESLQTTRRYVHLSPQAIYDRIARVDGSWLRRGSV